MSHGHKLFEHCRFLMRKAEVTYLIFGLLGGGRTNAEDVGQERARDDRSIQVNRQEVVVLAADRIRANRMDRLVTKLESTK